MRRLRAIVRTAFILFLAVGLFFPTRTVTAPPLDSPDPPGEPVKLVFVHHSTGGNWLADPNEDQPYGGLGRALMANNYYVSATNYGWGPEGIGDRTDIVNWPEWFLGPERDAITRALYAESSQNAGDFGGWSRLPQDPGGENAIVMFKSCFPNSDLEGRPSDPPLAEPNDYDYTVANAKAVYNALLGYFETRPDKLFVVVTAPPLVKGETSRGRAANARAFNTWLVHEWLHDYPLANVAVFDYYNVLTDPGNHHQWNGNAIEHVAGSGNDFSAYPSDDSHPSTEGHTKATAEFVPLLNLYYNRWQAGAPATPPEPVATAEPAATEESAPPQGDAVAGALRVVEDFEGDAGAWQASTGEDSSVVCVPEAGTSHSGESALHVAYDLPPEGWMDCARAFDSPQDWSGGDGLSIYLQADELPEWMTLMVFSGDPDAPTPFEIDLGLSSNSAGGWTQAGYSWESFAVAAWHDGSGISEIDPARIVGFGFSLGTGEAGALGELYIDDVHVSPGTAPPPEIPETENSEPEVPETNEDESTPTDAGNGLCASAPLALFLCVAGFLLDNREK